MTLARLSRWCYRRRRLVVLMWVAAFVLISVVGTVAGNSFTNSFKAGNTDSGAAFDLLNSRFPARAGDTADIVFQAPTGVQTAAVRAHMETLFADVGPGKVDHVVAIDSPYTAPGRISNDGTIAYATVTFDKQANDLPTKAAQPLIDAAQHASSDGIRVEVDGPVVAQAMQQQSSQSEWIGLIAAVVILFLAFGSLLAMSLPILSAVMGVGIGSVIVALLSHFISVPSFAPYLAVMIGLGVGIDYALFIVVRYRAGLHDGLTPEDADVQALATAGRAVLFAGCTVVVSLLGMFLMGMSLIYGFSLAAVLAVLMTMLASLTLVPAIIGFAGRKLAAKEHKVRHHRTTAAYRWSRQIQRRPWLWATLSLALLLALAIPALSLRLGVADQGNDPSSMTTRRAYDLLATGFGPGFNGPILLAADLHGTTTAASVSHLADSIRTDPDIAEVRPPIINEARDAAVIAVLPRQAPEDEATGSLVHRLRDHIHGANLSIHVGGVTAVGIDNSTEVGKRLPYMVVGVLILSFLLLMLVFRSILVAVKAVVVNLLSIGASYGVIVAIFQWGWFRDIIGIGRPGPIEFWLPMMLFTVVFGLSMDYEVFLLSRVREEYLLTGDNATAVADGLATTARVITAAAAVMVAVFVSFALGDMRVIKLMGLGLATAIFVDATVVRMVLVPATMELLGGANWWLPKWLDRLLPHVGIEAPAAAAPSTPRPVLVESGGRAL